MSSSFLPSNALSEPEIDVEVIGLLDGNVMIGLAVVLDDTLRAIGSDPYSLSASTIPSGVPLPPASST